MSAHAPAKKARLLTSWNQPGTVRRMGITYTEEQKRHLVEHAQGRTIVRLSYEEGSARTGPYWVIDLDDGTEFSFRFMAELV